MKVHLIGVCGTGMGSLACLLQQIGHDVRGSDVNVYPPMSDQLEALGIEIMPGWKAENLDWAPDLVIVGNVVSRGHAESEAAIERGIEYTSFPAALARFFLTGKKSCVVTGTHGKTTTTALLAHLLLFAGRDPGYLIGGVPIGFESAFNAGGGGEFVVEGDEYDSAYFDKGPKFLHYRPQIAMVTSVEFDHADIYDNLAVIEKRFDQFVELVPVDGKLIYCADEAGAVRAASAREGGRWSYGLGTGADWRACNVRFDEKGALFDIVTPLGEGSDVRTTMSGEHNLRNALGACAAACAAGVELQTVFDGLAAFRGVKRRQEEVGEAGGVLVLDDFAHHPTAVEVTTAAVKGRYPDRRLWAVFEPRSNTSRQSIFAKQYERAFAACPADEILLAPVFGPEKFGAENALPTAAICERLRAAGRNARATTSLEELLAILGNECESGDVVLMMSNGSFGGSHRKLLELLAARASDASL